MSVKTNLKRQKTYHFHKEWEEDYFFVISNSKCMCLICQAIISLPKKGNLERHFTTMHKRYENDFPAQSELRKIKLKELKSQLAAQQSIFTRPNTRGKAAKIASYRVCQVLAKHKKPFQDGAMVKEAFMEAADSLFVDFKNKDEIMSAIKDVQLSRSTMTRRCEEIEKNVTAQLQRDIAMCECFSLQFDESTDSVDVAQLCLFIRMMFDNMTAKEELLCILPLKGHTRGEDIFQAFMEFVNKIQLPLGKLVSITTDGAPAMVGCSNGFIAHCKQNDTFLDFIHYHCIIHQQALCGKILNMQEVMDIVMKIVCSVRARSLQRRLFHAHMEEADAEHTDLLLHTDVRWLSRGRFLERFRELLPDVKEFLKQSKHAEYAQLENEQWLMDLAFLTDITALLNELNLELQGKNKNVINMISSVNAFKRKLQLISTKLERQDLRYFQHMNSELARQGKTSAELNSAHYIQQVQSISSEFDKRFNDFASVEPVATYMCFPFATDIDVEDIAFKMGALFQLDTTALENEIVSLQNDIEMKSRATTEREKLWGLLLEEKYPNIRRCAFNLSACFGSTYLCESAFSYMKIIKSKYRSTMTDDHLLACMRLATTCYYPDYKKLAASSQCQVSH
ncbi:general transcription factor II-I repeat domain-containing protein 2A-like [Watersipora subatra]|uniref:general transcription factor II-I repeat domain-containing protein 2A-like n=2 Tax=Watersipora subatra TaxID=2589382 RepID=UPI00355C67D5